MWSKYGGNNPMGGQGNQGPGNMMPMGGPGGYGSPGGGGMMPVGQQSPGMQMQYQQQPQQMQMQQQMGMLGPQSSGMMHSVTGLPLNPAVGGGLMQQQQSMMPQQQQMLTGGGLQTQMHQQQQQQQHPQQLSGLTGMAGMQAQQQGPHQQQVLQQQHQQQQQQQGSGQQNNPSGSGNNNMLAISSQPNTHKEINIVQLSRLGQETVQDIASRFQEVFSALKNIQPTPHRDNSTEKKVQEYFRTIRLLFKRVRIIYEKCNDAGMEYTHVESLIPYKDEPDPRVEATQCEEYRKVMQENQELIETVKLKNRQLREIIDRTRIIIWEINTMLAMRRS